jgi:hypothetical protein
MVRAGAGIFDKQEPEPHNNGPAPQRCIKGPMHPPLCCSGTFFRDNVPLNRNVVLCPPLYVDLCGQPQQALLAHFFLY